MAKIICLSEQKKSYSDTYVIFCGKTKCKNAKVLESIHGASPFPAPIRGGAGGGVGRECCK